MLNLYKKIEIFLLIILSFSPLFDMKEKLFLLIILLIINYRWIFKISINKKILMSGIYLLILFVEIFNFYTLNEINISGFGLTIYIILSFLMGAIISEKYEVRYFLSTLEKIMYPFVLFSLVGYVITFYFPELILNFPNYYYYHTTHKTIFIQNFLITEGYPLKRNSGIAWEPGVYQFILNLNMIYLINLKKRIIKLKLFVYILAILSTYSSTGVIIFIIIFINFIRKRIKRINKFYIIIGSLILLYFLVPIVDKIIFKKIFSGGVGVTERTNPIKETFNVIDWKILFGIGNLKFKELTIGSHDSYIQILGRYGIIMLCIIVRRILKLRNFILISLILLSFFSQVIWITPLITPFYFYGKVKYRIRRKL